MNGTVFVCLAPPHEVVQDALCHPQRHPCRHYYHITVWGALASQWCPSSSKLVLDFILEAGFVFLTAL